MDIEQLYNDHLRKLPNEYGDVSVMNARLKNEFTEDEKYHNLMRWFISEITLYELNDPKGTEN